jgi:3-oxoacyl-(acyl-carrier-protein) synthase
MIAPTINLDRPRSGMRPGLRAQCGAGRPVSAVLSNNLGFGGQNASVVFRRL